jgi:CRISPR-associated protein Cpf1
MGKTHRIKLFCKNKIEKGDKIMANYYEGLTNKYSVSKTLRNSLIPVGKTLDYIKMNHMLDRDIQRRKDYAVVKKMIDAYHLKVINEALEGKKLSALDRTAELYFLGKRTDEEEKELEECFTALRKEIVVFLRSHEKFGILDKKNLIEEELNKTVCSEGELAALKNFEKFTSYFTNFNTVRMNLYSDEKKSSTVAYRLIEENLPRFFDNISVFNKIKDSINQSDLTETLELYNITDIGHLFLVDEYNYLLTQNGIDIYNSVIGKINQIINLHNQQNKNEAKLPKMKVLYKQILADRDKKSFIEEFTSDEELICRLREYSEELGKFLHADSEKSIISFINTLNEATGEGIFVKNDTSLTSLSVICCGSWNYMTEQISSEYDNCYTGKKKLNTEKYDDEKKKALNKYKSYSLKKLQEICDDTDIIKTYSARIYEDIEKIDADAIKVIKTLDNHDAGRKLFKNTNAVGEIKAYLDDVKKLEADIKLLMGTGMEPERNALFYGEYTEVYDNIQKIDALYNMTRNYLTKKPFSTEKIKLNFDKTTLLSGWDKNKEHDNLGVLLEKDGIYYLGIINKDNNKIFDEVHDQKLNSYHKMEYKLLPGPNKMLPKVFFSNARREEFNPSDELLEKYDRGTHKKGENFSVEDCHALIDFFKKSINKHEDWKNFDFHFSPTESYEDISGFYAEVKNQGYKVSFKNVDSEYIDSLVDSGALYLFKIYNKDFSEYSKGNYNLHTLYWKMLFDERNLSDVVYALNGGAEVFYRPASIFEEDKIVHKHGTAIANKRSSTDKPTSTFDYDIVKDKRYTEDRFELHVPITMNFTAEGSGKLNAEINGILKQNDGIHVIGIDRGERNLLYVVVVNPKGEIVHQISLNEIVSKYNGNEVKVNYHELLDNREKQRDAARKSWETIESIKELKEGYMSQVVHVIAQLIIQYNAVIAVEDLNFGFMRGRQKVEKQIYQKFEKMLIDKLNFLVTDKGRGQENPYKAGGSLNALQLTDKFESFKKIGKQTGVIYYVPAWMTSKIDPTTGFVNLFNLKYTNLDEAKRFWGKFESIRFNSEKNYFEISFDYSKYTYKADGSRTKWTICSYGERIEKYRNVMANNSWDDREVDPTELLKQLFDKYGLIYKAGNNLVEDITAVDEGYFFKELYHCLKLILQIRNSSKDGKRDYLQSCVMNDKGYFFNSDSADSTLPRDADANGAFNIARKGLWILEQIKSTDDEKLGKVKLAISNKEWLCYAQEHRSING